mgnify:CR=1 FL=1
MFTSRIVIFLAAMFWLPATAWAEPLSYNYVELDYLDLDTDVAGVNFDGDGWAVGGSAEFAPNWYVLGRYADSELERSTIDLDLEQITLGAGYHVETGDVTSFFGNLTFEDIDIDVADDSGFGLEGGARFALGSRVELGASLKYLDVGDVVDGELGFKLSSVVDVHESIGLTLDFESIDDLDVISLGGRVYF